MASLFGGDALAQAALAPAPSDEVSNGKASNGAPDDNSPLERFRRGVASFEYGDCTAAVGALEDIAVPGVLGDEDQLIDAYRILGVCYFQAGRSSEAVRSLEALLYIDPTYQMDPFRTPPPVTELFEQRKELIRKKLEQIEEEKRRQQPDAIGGTLVIERERVLKQTPFATVFLPFGASQYINGEGGKGLIIGGLQGAALAANLIATITAFSIDASTREGLIGAAPLNDHVAAQAYTVAWAASVVALAGLVASYTYGVADAWWNRVPEQEVSNTERHHRVEGEEAKKLLRRLDGEE